MNLTEQHVKTMDEWRFCPMANYICPTARETKNEANTPRGLALTAYLFYRGKNDFSADAVRTFYECSLGGLCKTTALDASDVPALIRAVRAEIVARKKAPQEVYRLRDRIIAHQSLSATDEQATYEPSAAADDARTLYFGTPWYSPAHEATVKSGADLLNLAEVSFSVPASQLDTGALLYELGFHDEVKTFAQAILNEIERRQVKKVIFSSAYDLRAFSVYYAELGIHIPDELKVEPLAETLREQLDQGHLKPARMISKQAAYLDPSYLVHELQIGGTSRQILTHLMQDKPVELRWQESQTRYCGGAGLQFLYPTLARRVIARNIGELVGHRKLGLLVSECPFCVREIQQINTGFQVVDLPSLLLSTIQGGR